jgi:peroxiredoxin Q/BCP
MIMSLAEGQAAVDFTLLDEAEKPHTLSQYQGTPVILYFYPKDDTPGCTTEACNFRDDYDAYQKAGVVILGVSTDSPASHAKFKAKYHLPFHLLADTAKQVVNLYGVWGTKHSMGRTYEGTFRTTFLIGQDGKILKIYENVKPAEHSAEILAALKEIG